MTAILKLRRLSLALLLACTFIPASGHSQEEVGPWEMISEGIFAQIPDYEEIEPRLYRRVGGIVVPPATGEVFAILNRDYGVFKSIDHGETWEKVESPVKGRVYGGFAISLDAQTGRFAVFMAETNKFKIDPVGGMTLDGGATWTALPRPAQASRHDGFTWGGVDWTAEKPQVLLGKQHHAWITMWRTTDAAKSWEKLEFESRNVGVLDETIFVAGVDNFVTDRKPEVKPGIYRSTDSGENWEQVSDKVVSGKAPVLWGENAYWTYADGVLVSRDQGASWQQLGAALPGALYGPHFGLSESEMMVVTPEAFFITRDAGETWQQVADNPAGGGVAHPTVSFGWDPTGGYLYYAPVGGDVYRSKISE